MTDTFDPLRYVAGYPDLIVGIGADEGAARLHYDTAGRNEGRDPFKFNPLAYAAASIDLLKGFGDNSRALSLHYIKHGFAEGRTVTFDALAYAASYADLLLGYGADAEALTRHYVQHGFAEGRTVTFDALAYGASHADLLRGYGADAEALARHYVQHGFAEGRSVTFDALAYGASYPDLLMAYGADAKALSRHYVQHGFAEGRAITFDAAAYAAVNPDLEAAYGSDEQALALHFIRSGFAEGRAIATIVGSQSADILSGTSGRDIVAGGAGDDVFIASAGGDRYFGGAGLDTLDFSAVSGAITIDQIIGFATVASHGLAGDELISIEKLILGAGNDRVTLDGSQNIVFGGAGSDEILGRGGGDELHGGEGDDLLSSFFFNGPVAAGTDRLFGEGGNDTLILGDRGGVADGGAGSDSFIIRNLIGSATLTLEGGAGTDFISSSMIGNLLVKSDGSIQMSDRASGEARAILSGIEHVSYLPMTPFGIADGVVKVTGEGGAAFAFFNRGNHEIRGEFRAADPNGSAGFNLSHGEHIIDATVLGVGRMFFQTAGKTQAIVRGNADIEFDINGDSNVALGDGSDRFVVRSGTSTLDGGGGNDTLWILTAAPTSAAMSINLVLGLAADTQGISVSFVRIENAIAGDGDDVIIGNDEANVLRGLGGNDRIYGGGTGNDGRFDILIGREGDDLLVGGAGYDSLRGELDNDLLVDRANGSFSGDEGDDVIVVLLDDPATSVGHVAFVNGDAGADTTIISAVFGTFGDIWLSNFRQEEGDLIDLSNLRDSAGGIIDLADLVAAATSTAGGLRIGLEGFRSSDGTTLSGQLLFASLDEATDLTDGMFVFQSGMDWRSQIPTDWIL